MDPHLQQLAARQEDIVAAWQLIGLGWNRRRVENRAAHDGWRRIHRGVYAISQAPLSRRQAWLAATLTSPSSFLSHASAADCFGFRPFRERLHTITRPGRGGRRRSGRLLVYR